MLVFLQFVVHVRFVELRRIVFFESDHDALLGGVFGPCAEEDDACTHLIHLLRKAQVQCALLSEELDGVTLGVPALVEYHRENSFGVEQVTEKFSCFFGVVFGEVRGAAEILEDFAEGFVTNGIGYQVHVFAVAAKSPMQQLKCALMDADSCDGLTVLGAFRDCITDDFFVLVDDPAFDTFEAGESTVRIQRVPEDSLENVAGRSAYFQIGLRIFEVLYRAAVSSLGVECLVDWKSNRKKCRIENIRHSQQNVQQNLVCLTLRQIPECFCRVHVQTRGG